MNELIPPRAHSASISLPRKHAKRRDTRVCCIENSREDASRRSFPGRPEDADIYLINPRSTGSPRSFSRSVDVCLSVRSVDDLCANFRLSSVGLLFTALCSACILGLVYFIVDRVSPPPALIPNSMRVKIPRCGLIKLSTLYALSGILVSLSLDRNRVLCHLQDPIKSITLVFSLVYYFFFCRKSECLDEYFFELLDRRDLSRSR